MTADSRSGDIINIEGATVIRRDEEHRLVEWEPRDLGNGAVAQESQCSR